MSEDDATDEDEDEAVNHRKRKTRDEADDLETTYARRTATKHTQAEEDDKVADVGHLPIKLPGGVVQHVEGTTRIQIPESKRPVKVKQESDGETEYSESEAETDVEEEREEMARTKGRFGRMGIADILGDDGAEGLPWRGRDKARAARRLDLAKEQMARIGAEVMAGGELMDNVSPPCRRVDRHADARVAAALDEALDILAGKGPAA
jgi:nucleolar complex protein 3